MRGSLLASSLLLLAVLLAWWCAVALRATRVRRALR